MKYKLILGLFGCIVFLCPPLLLADQLDDDWLTRTSKHFEIHYKAYQQQDADQLLLQAERIHKTVAPFFKTAPTVTHIVLRDRIDITNAFAAYDGFKIEMWMTPPDNIVYELASLKDWRHDILLHEYVHILNFHALGFKSYLWSSMLLEGLAVYMESKNDQASGRLNSTYYRMLMRQEVASGHFKSWQELTIRNLDWPANKQYLYGAFFTQYLVDTYGEQAYIHFLEQAQADGVDAAELKEAFNKDFYALWQDFAQAMRQKFAPELAARQNINQSSGKRLLHDQALPLAFVQQDRLYSSYTDSRANRRLATYTPKTDTWNVVDDFPQAMSVDSHPTSGILVTTLANTDIHSQHMVLKLYQNHHWRTLPHLTHIHHARWMPDGKHIVGIQVQWMQASILLIDPEKPDQPTRLWQGSKDEILGKFAVDPSGRYLMIQHQHSGSHWNLVQFDLQKKTWTPVTDTSFTEHDPLYKDAHHVLFSADYDGTYNIYELNLKTRLLTRYTDTTGGAVAPLWNQRLGLIYRDFGTKGYQLMQLAQPKPLKTSRLPLRAKAVIHHSKAPIVPTTAEIASFKAHQPYSPWGSLAPHKILPTLSISSEDTDVGVILTGADTLNRHQYTLTTTYALEHQYFNVETNYIYNQEWVVTGRLDHHYQDLKMSGMLNERDEIITRHKTIALTKKGLLYLDDGHFTTDLTGWYRDITEVNPPPSQPAGFYSKYGVTLNNRWNHITVNGAYPGSQSGLATGLSTSYVQSIQDQTHAGILQGYVTGAMNLTRSTSLRSSIRGGYTSSANQLFSLGGVQAPHALDSQSINIHGYASGHAQARYYAASKLTIRQLLLHVDRSFGLSPIGIGNLYGSIFTEAAQAWLNPEQKTTLASVGVSLTYELAFNEVRLPFKFSFAKGLTDDAPKNQFELELTLNPADLF